MLAPPDAALLTYPTKIQAGDMPLGLALTDASERMHRLTTL
jgi:hypothetical protein